MDLKKLFFVCCLCFLVVACVTKRSVNNFPEPFEEPSNGPSKNKQLVALYASLELNDTLKVFSTQFLDDTSYKFHGKKFDSLQLSWFPEKFNFYYDEDQPVYACYKFKIDNYNWGLITRVYSEYVSSKIQLFIYDKQKDSIYNYRDLAEDFGDGGDVILQTSWLYLNKNKSVGCFTNEGRFHYNETDTPGDTSISRESYYKYVQLLGEDTVTVIDEKLKKIFR